MEVVDAEIRSRCDPGGVDTEPVEEGVRWFRAPAGCAYMSRASLASYWKPLFNDNYGQFESIDKGYWILALFSGFIDSSS